MINMNSIAALRGTGDAFLITWGWFLAVMLAVLFLYTAYRCFRRGREASHTIGMVVFCLGLLYMWILPPLSAPDEILHFAGAYEISNILMGQSPRDENGNVIIRAEDEFIVNWPGDNDLTKATVLGQIPDRGVYREIHERGFSGSSEKGYSITLQRPVGTIKTAYICPAIGIILARIIGLGGIGVVFLGRLMNLVLFSVCISSAVKRIPTGKWILSVIALFPMTLELAASFSYDAYILSLSVLLTAEILRLACSDEMIRTQDIVLMGMLAVLLSPCKMIYSSLFFMAFMISFRKWKSRRSYLLTIFLIGGLIIAAVILTNLREFIRYINVSGETVAPELTSAGTVNTVSYHNLSEMKNDPTLILRVIRNTVMILGKEYMGTMAGMWLCAMDREIGAGTITLTGCYGVLLCAVLFRSREEVRLTVFQRGVLIITVLLFVLMLSVSMFLAFTPNDVWYILGIQGRYLTPVLPAFCLIFSGFFSEPGGNGKTALLQCCLPVMVLLNAVVLLKGFSVICARFVG